MPERIFIRPRTPETVVRDPFTHQPLKAEGEWKPRIKFWLSRKAEGSVVETLAPEPAAAAPAPAEKKRQTSQSAEGDKSWTSTSSPMTLASPSLP